MKRYNLRIEITDNDLEDVTILERNSDEPTWMWMANTMFDALRGASFVLPENIDFPSISEIVEEWEEFDEEDPRSDGEDDGSWIPFNPSVETQPVADDVNIQVKYSDGYITQVWPARWFVWSKEDMVAWRYADQDIGYGGTD